MAGTSWTRYLFSRSVWINPFDNCCLRKCLVKKFCFSRIDSSGCMMISEALNNSKTAPVSFKYPPRVLEKWSSSEKRVNGSTEQDKELVKPFPDQSKSCRPCLLNHWVPEETSYPLTRNIRNAIAQVAVSKNTSSFPWSQYLFDCKCHGSNKC